MNARVSAAVLGASDGCTSISGVIAGGAGAHIAHSALGVTAIGGALAATASMAGAEMLSQDRTDWGSVGAMGAGTLLGSALPAIPLLALAGTGAWFVIVAVALVIGVVVAVVRWRTTPRSLPKSIVQTLAVLLVGGLVGYAVGSVG